MNGFDAIVIVGLVIAAIFGFRAGLLRSALTILGYVIAMPIAVWATSLIVAQFGSASNVSTTQNSIIFFGAFLAAGIVMGSLLRMTLDEMIGSDIGLGDRLAGALLGAVRVVLVAVTVVLIFNQLVPATMQPSYLVDSRLRPVFSHLGQMGLQTLPSEATDYIDRWKRDRHL